SLPQRSAGAPQEPESSPKLGDGVHSESRYELERLLKSSELAWQSRVEILERRLEKMGRLLEGVGNNSDNAIPLEVGVPSRFQAVQGLSTADTQFEAKSGLMSALFLANQKMREGLNGRSAG
ncbi:MAG: hypothetical protein JKY61_03750, partial [Planctomycetes bacterium]|nr:hypothetical protein [Planctomycetota bacterium]